MYLQLHKVLLSKSERILRSTGALKSRSSGDKQHETGKTEAATGSVP